MAAVPVFGLSMVHQTAFSLLSTLPFAIGQVQVNNACNKVGAYIYRYTHVYYVS